VDWNEFSIKNCQWSSLSRDHRWLRLYDAESMKAGRFRNNLHRPPNRHYFFCPERRTPTERDFRWLSLVRPQRTLNRLALPHKFAVR
jgi:hypothetical protein